VQEPDDATFKAHIDPLHTHTESGISKTGYPFIDFFTGGGMYMPRTHFLINEKGNTDWTWIVILLTLTATVFLSYVKIFIFWMRSYFSEQSRDRNSKLFDLGAIFLLCSLCGYGMSILMFFWPGYRLLAVMLLILNVFSWKFCLNLQPFQKAFSTNRLERQLRQQIESRAKQLEQEIALRTTQIERLAQIAHRTGNAVIITNASGLIEWANEGFVRFTGYTLEEVQGRKPGSFLQGPNTSVVEIARIRNAINQGLPVTSELVNYAKSGSEYLVRIEIEPLRDAAGTLTGFMSIESEITEYRQTQLQLAKHAREMEQLRDIATEANRAKSEFLANMSHEIRTPLTAILGFADLLLEDGDLSIAPKSRLETIDTIKRAGAHLFSIINDVLDLSKIEAGKMTVEKIDTKLPDLIKEVTNLLRPRAAGKGLTLTVQLDTPIPDRVYSDPTRLRQILMNIVGNAIKFTEIGSVKLRVSSRIEENPYAFDVSRHIVIDVEDSGPGMTREQTTRLFEAFSQADSTVTRHHGGTGLGLVICKRLARLMGGDVCLVQSVPGVGSCFRIELPCTPVEGSVTLDSFDIRPELATPVVIAPLASRSLMSARILLAEDGIDNQRLIAFHLKKAGAQVDIADNGAIALEMHQRAAATSTPYNLIITDIQMPIMDGNAFTKALRDRGIRTPIIALTAHAMKEDRERSLLAGCDDYATKPIDKATLVETCERWLAYGETQRISSISA